MNEAVKSFFSNMLAVVLGIVITFTVQGMIDRAGDRREVRKALELVRTELVSNREDIRDLREYLAQERVSAQYLEDHAEYLEKLERLDSATVDSVTFNQSFVYADVSVALPHDALELLKMSSLFQKIGDNSLSMKIIRAYDCCQLLVDNMNRYISKRDAQPSEETARWILEHETSQYTDATDIDKAVTAINKFLRE